MKPDPAIYRTAINQLSLKGQAPLFIDDVQHNLHAAHAFGWRGLRFESAQQVREQLVVLGLLEQKAALPRAP